MDLLGAVTGLPKWLRVALAVGAAVALLGAGWGLWLHFHDKGLIDAHDAKNAAIVTRTELHAEQTADANDAARQQTRAVQAKDLNDARDEAIRSKPDETAKPAGPAVSATLDRLRRQAAGNKHSTR